MTPDSNLTRREALRRVTVALGGTISAPTLAGLLAGCGSDSTPQQFVPRTLSPDELRLVGVIAEHIIPTTDTPGATTARVHEFVDLMLTDFFSDAQRQQFLTGLHRVEEMAVSTFGASFEQRSAEDQVSILEALDAEAFSDSGGGTDAPQSAESAGPPFMRTMKELTVSGYYTSEVGQRVELRTVPFGEYRADMPLDDVGRAWA